MVDAETRAWLVEQGRVWTRTERDTHRPHTELIPGRGDFARWFEPRILQLAEYRMVPVIDPPPWRAEALARGVPDAIDFSRLAGITHQDTILVSRARTRPADVPALFFHELVHVVQYDLLGVDEFVRQYVHGLAAGGFRYETNPLEADAYALEASFRARPAVHWSVRLEVERRLRARS